jgi:hypothetical protein
MILCSDTLVALIFKPTTRDRRQPHASRFNGAGVIVASDDDITSTPIVNRNWHFDLSFAVSTIHTLQRF